ncbi:hypothetical protein Tco_0253093 [Tanacetum coccineum]
MRHSSQARRHDNHKFDKRSVESSNLEKPDNLAHNYEAIIVLCQLLEAPTEGYEMPIVRQSRNKAVVAKMIQALPPRNFIIFAELKDMAAAANFNQANSGYRPPMVSNQIRPPGFPPVQNPHANNQKQFQIET